MIHLLLGEDRLAKDEKISEIKRNCLSSPDALKFDYEVLSAVKLDSDELKKSLITLPAVSPQRLLLIRSIEKLNTKNKDILSEFMRLPDRPVVLILDSDQSSLKGEFFRELEAAAQVARFTTSGKKEDIWAMTRAMERRRPADALKILDALLEDGDAPLKVMGGLVWFWGSIRSRLSKEGFKKGLLVLQEADLNIKRSRLKPEHAVEVAVTQLSSLIAC